MKLLINFLIIMAFIFGGISPSFSQNPEQLYQKGLIKEEGEGALNEAIEIFNKVVEIKDAEKALQAKALLHIGLCYEKLGNEQAAKAYQKLVNNFPGQKSEVAIAKERLSRLILATKKVAKTPLTPKFTKIKIPTELSWNVALSPDGKELALVSAKKLWKMPLSGNLGQGIPGTPVQLNTDTIEVEWTGLSWSRDGKWIAFNENPKKDKKEQSIYIVSSKGDTPKKIIETNRDVRTVNYRISLSPNGKKLAYSSVADKKQFIHTISVDGTNPKQLTDMEAREPVFSPDGKMIAYVEDKKTGTGSGDLGLWIVPANGGTPHLVANADMASSPVWSPNRNMIAYLDIIDGKKICIVPVSNDGESKGNTTSFDIPEGIGRVIVLTGWTPDNKIGALVNTKVERGLYTLPAKGGQAAIVLQGVNPVQPRWSKNSKKIYYTKENNKSSWTNRVLAVVPTKGGKGQVLPRNKDALINIPYQYQASHRISPNGKIIISAASSKEMVSNKYPGTQIWKIPIDGGTPTQLTNPNPSYGDFAPCWSPDGEKVAFLRVPLNVFSGKNTHETSLYTLKSNGGDPELLIKDHKFMWSLVWSPDGKMIAYHTYNKDDDFSAINVVNIIDGKSRMATEIPNSHVHIELAWSPDSKRIAFNDHEGKVIKVMSLSEGSIEDIETNLVDVYIYHLDWSPDGERFVFAGMKGGKREFWFLEDFMPLNELAIKKEAKELEGIRIKQISKEPYLDDLGTVSSDGRFRSNVDWGNGNLAIYNLKNGEKRLLTNTATQEEDPQKFVIRSAISKNGKLVAYSWWRPNHTFDLHLMDVDNPSSPRLLYKKEGEEVYPVTWLSDKEVIAIRQNRKDNTTQITSFNVLNGTFHDLKLLNTRWWMQLSTSPDEKYMAYNHTNEINGGNTDINLLSVDSKNEIPLINHPANDRVLGWLPGRNEFLFISDRSGTWDLWAIPIENGNPSRPIKKIYTDIGDVQPLGIIENGNCYFGFSRRNFITYIAPFNDKTGELNEQAGKSMLGSSFHAKWSPNGQYIAYIKEDNKAASPWQLTIQDLNTHTERTLGNSLNSAMDPCWSPDGKSIIVIGRDKNKISNNDYNRGIFQIDVKTGNTKEILLLSDYKYNKPDDDASPLSRIEWSLDGKNIFYLFFRDRLVKHNLKTGEDAILYENSHFNYGILNRSPDGKSLLFAVYHPEDKKSHLFKIPVEGGKAEELCTSQEADSFHKAFWSPDGKDIYFTERSDETKIWKIAAEGGIPQEVWQSQKRLEFLNISPNGNQIAFSIRERTTEIRVIENLKKEVEKIYSKNE